MAVFKIIYEALIAPLAWSHLVFVRQKILVDKINLLSKTSESLENVGVLHLDALPGERKMFRDYFNWLRLLFRTISLISTLLGTSHLLAAEAYTLPTEMRGEALGRYMDFYVDTQGLMSLEDILAGKADAEFKSSQRDFPTFGFGSAKAIWAKLKVENPAKENRKIYLAQNHAFCDKLTLYSWDTSGVLKAETQGDLVAFRERPLGHRYPVFILELRPGTNTFLLQLNTVSSAAFKV